MDMERFTGFVRSGIKFIIGASIIASFIANAFPATIATIRMKFDVPDPSLKEEPTVVERTSDIFTTSAENKKDDFVSVTESAADDITAAVTTTATAVTEIVTISTRESTLASVAVPEEPVISSEESSSDTVSEQGDKLGLVNINTATAEQLMTLKGIGEVKSQAIIDYRNKNGAFRNIDQLLFVKGIGEKTLDKIRDYITV